MNSQSEINLFLLSTVIKIDRMKMEFAETETHQNIHATQLMILGKELN